DHASMVLTPAKGTTIQDLETIKKLCTAIGFTHIQISSPREHDEMIAFTSQLAHVVSGAYIKSPTAEKHQGFSAGSYKDMTRVAALNESMWTELFLANRDNLSEEISTLIAHLEEYKTALDHQDEEALYRLLQEGRKRKEVIDHQQF
ncbi:MAG: prephenate dehydrogenase dimerization domain-containing protein, partial [Anaerovoracaceae bacterium]